MLGGKFPKPEKKQGRGARYRMLEIEAAGQRKNKNIFLLLHVGLGRVVNFDYCD